MKHILTIACGAVALAFSSASFAQGNHHRSAPVEAPENGEELAETFEFILSTDAAVEMLATVRKDVSLRGEALANWNTQSIYMPGRTAPGETGSDASMSVAVDSEVPSMTRFDGGRFDLPEGYRSIEITASDDEPMSRTLMGGLRGLWFEFTGNYERVGNAHCYERGGGVTIHFDESRWRWTEDSVAILALIYGVTQTSTETEYCTVYKQVGENRFAAYTYDREGRPFTKLNEDTDIYEIRPATEAAERMLTMQAKDQMGL